ncbi:MAG: Mutator mutT protein [Candidatus Woesebacteria bacterium GW2011_GWA1_37_7]|uniref:Mutator mutT protein n=1 Tax=Candidatus Woesebacteria bacterium GW2011_GWA1_37_7 TaxID=1618545 RepID=A0A0G0K9Z7_9BACT|nr:MAG: Mutator mutT protein [Candidatus Woesebacteria bacterium GW2011_GWA1_37_7]
MAEETINTQTSDTITNHTEAPKIDLVGVKLLMVIKNDKGENEFLIMHRIPEKYPDATAHWDFPGGRVEPGQRFNKSLLREVKEETDLSVKFSKAFYESK